MIIGAHAIIYSTNSEVDRAFFRDVLKFKHVDAGGGWLVFGMPPVEAAFHPAESNGKHEFYLMCENIENFISRMTELNVPCTDIHEEPWGRLVNITLPGGGPLGVYQPKHDRPA
ncbi:MAG: hypothetical protein DHS20C01_03850 [marine bacterium B5-7]|nr:MAG: hypothetical protein DHS20C01_03850 [marine bacterium B5-7]